MKFNEFKNLAAEYNLIPVFEKITADMLTPVLAFLKMRQNSRECFLLESVEGKESLGRYSFIGKDPRKLILNYGHSLTIIENGISNTTHDNLFEVIREEIKSNKCPVLEELPFFTGGLVGYIGYENICLIEDSIEFESHRSENPDSILGVYNTIIAFDHFKHQIILLTSVPVSEDTDLEKAYLNARQQLIQLKQELSLPLSHKSDFQLLSDVQVSIAGDEFEKLVLESKEKILEGDIFQIVLSKRFSAQYKGDLLNVYRALRILNPSPYMYFLEFNNDFSIIGTSPENLVKVKGRIVETMPIAGTRRRGHTPGEDDLLEKELINDPKERAEHVMLLDLGRNDLGRVCEYNSIKVVQNMEVQKYSHVMHMVSRVEGLLSPSMDAIDAFKACFPAGTVTGAPKIRAVQLIDGFENLSRNVYAGAIGHIDFTGNLDMCIAIRTLYAKGETISWQAGAGIVADSVPELEAKEIKNKSEVLFNALTYAGSIDENTGN